MEPLRSAQLGHLADENLVASMTYLRANAILGVSLACKQFLSLAHADVLWMPVADRRWRFGTLPTSTKNNLPPGARERASACALAAAAQANLHSQDHVFNFFVKRCRQDATVAQLVLQFHSALMLPKFATQPVQPGTIVRIVNLESNTKYNGARAVITPSVNPKDGRYPVMLPLGLKSLLVKSQNLDILHTCITKEEAEDRVLAASADSIDALVRLAAKLSKGTPLYICARHLLSRAKEQWAVHQWELLRADPGRADLLEEGGLVVSQWAAPGEVDVAAVRGQLAEMAGAAAARTTSDAPLMERIEAVNAVLFDDWGFRGATDNYYDPENSFLHAVLRTRRGIPITLSIIWAMVARRLDVPCFLCNMPQHIIIRVSTGHGSAKEDIYVDAFGHRVLDYKDLLQFAARIFGMGASLEEEHIAQRPATMIYLRLLRNLKNIYKKMKSNGEPATIEELAGILRQYIAIAGPDALEETQLLGHVRNGQSAYLMAAHE